MRTTRLQVKLRDVEPEVVRVVDVPATSTLPELHELLQAALGWTDSHLHQFVVGQHDWLTRTRADVDTVEVRYGVPSDDDWDDRQVDETQHHLRDLPSTFVYLYDFGDGWEHDVTVLGAGDPTPGCRSGHGACPPEDCGGPGGYEHLRAVLADPRDPEHLEMSLWAGSLPEFDLATTDTYVRETVGQVPESVRLLLDLAAGGIRLTPGGRLPRTVVRQMQTHRPGWAYTARPAAMEDDLPALCALHDLLRHVGLLRLSRGVLTPTKAAADDLHVLRRLRTAFTPADSFRALLATDAVATVATMGATPIAALAEDVADQLGDRWVHRDGTAMTTHDVRATLAGLQHELLALDQITVTPLTWHPGPAARSLLVRATALIHLARR